MDKLNTGFVPEEYIYLLHLISSRAVNILLIFLEAPIFFDNK